MKPTTFNNEPFGAKVSSVVLFLRYCFGCFVSVVFIGVGLFLCFIPPPPWEDAPTQFVSKFQRIFAEHLKHLCRNRGSIEPQLRTIDLNIYINW